MNLSGIKIMVVFILIIVPIGLILLVNLPRQERYKQFWAPVIALVFSLAAAAIVNYVSGLLQTSVMTNIFDLIPAEVKIWLLDFKWIIINSLFLYIFFIVKGLGIINNRTLRWLQRWGSLRSWLTRLISVIGLEPARILGKKPAIGPRDVALAYYFTPEKGIYLKPGWLFASLFFAWVSLLPFLLILTMLFITFKFPTSDIIQYFPELPATTLIMLLEIAIFLRGPRLSEVDASMEGNANQTVKKGKYDSLFREYTETWPERILASGVMPEISVAGGGNDPKFCSGNASLRLWCEKARSADGNKRNEALDCWVYCSVVNELAEGKNVLVTDPVHADISPFIFSYLLDILADGQHALVVVKDPASISDTVQWMQAGLKTGDGIDGIWKVISFNEYLRNPQEPDILVVDLSCVRTDPWFDMEASWMEKIGLMFFPEGFGLEPEQAASARSLINRLNDLIINPMQFLVFSKSYEGREPWIRELIKAPLNEYCARLPRSGQVYYIIWKVEGNGDYQSSILPRLSALFIGEEIPISLPALRAGVEVVRLIKQQTQPWHEYLEELQKHHQMLQEYGLPVAKAMTLNRYFVNQERNWQVPAEPTNFLVVRDDEFNLVKTLISWWSRGYESCFIHIISPPYLLRDYLSGNIEYYCQAEPFISAWTPAILESRRASGYLLLKRLQHAFIGEEEIVLLLNRTGIEFRTVRQGVLNLLREAFGDIYDFSTHLQVRMRDIFDPSRHDFDQLAEYNLQAAEFDELQPEWFDLFEIIDDTGNLLDVVASNRVDRIYLPQQLHAFAGKLYQVRDIDRQQRRVRMSFVDPSSGSRPAQYRIRRVITVRTIGEAQNSPYQQRVSMGSWQISQSLRLAQYDVRIDGYYRFEKDFNLTEKEQIYVDLINAAEMKRSYENGRILEILICRADGSECNHGGRVAFALAVLMQELLCTLFPHGFQLLAVGTPLPPDFFNEDPFSIRLKGLYDNLECFDIDGGNDEIRLFIIEDSEVELGVLEAFANRWKDLLRLIEDYLAWLLEEGPQTENESSEKPASSSENDTASEINQGYAVNRPLNSRYLCYGSEKIPAVFDLEALLQLIRDLPLGEWLGPARRAHQKNDSDRENRERALACCDFCGKMFPAAQHEVLQDQRVRCPECSRTSVNTMEELKPLYQQARNFLNKYFNINIRKEIKFRFTDAEQMSCMSGLPFTATDERDPRAVGLAMQDNSEKGRQVAIYIENGAPAQATLCTLVHELTHIWQYDNLDTAALTLEQVEGLATWSEIAFLERTGNKTGADLFRAELEQRNDEYWRGLQIVDQIVVRFEEYPHPFDYFQRNFPYRVY